jgi:hypothetical protein
LRQPRHPQLLSPSCCLENHKTHVSPLPTIVEESSPSVLEVPPPPPTTMDFCHVTAVQESEVDEQLWHISRVPYNSSKTCLAMHAVTKEKCTVKIVSNFNSTPAPAYLGVWNYYKFTKPKAEKFFFGPTTLSVMSKVHVASGSTNYLLTKNNFRSLPCDLSSLIPTSLVPRS